MNFETCDVDSLFLFKKDAEKKNDLKQRRLLKQLLKNLINEGKTIIKKKIKNKNGTETVKRLNTKVGTSEIEKVLTSKFPELKIKKLEPRVKTGSSSALEVKLQNPPIITCVPEAKPSDTQKTHCSKNDIKTIQKMDLTETTLNESDESVKQESNIIEEDMNDAVTPISDSETEDNNDVADSETKDADDWFEANFDIPPAKKRKAKCKPQPTRFKKDDPLYLELMVFECSVCEQSCSTESEFEEHLNTNSSCVTSEPEDNIKFKCKECSKYFQTSKGVRNHIRMIHSKYSRKLPCDQCNREFNSQGALVKHVFRDHEVRLYSCHICNKSYSDKHILDRHINSVHHKLYKQICPVCGIVLLGGYGLKNHMYTHSDLKLFKCDQCPAAYKVKMDLITHLRLHTGERPYSCTVCLRKFTNNSSLHKHMRSHGDYVIVKLQGFKK